MLPGMSAQAAIADFIGRVEHGRNVHYLHVSAVCLFIYDCVTTLSAEVSLIWPAPWGAGKILFLLTRYLAWPEFLFTMYMEFYATETATCHNIFAYMTWSIVVTSTVSETILIIRTWAIWDGRKSILFGLGAILLVLTATLSYEMALYIRESEFVLPPTTSPAVPACFLNSTSRRVGMAWLSWTSFELVIVVMTLIKGLQHFQHGSSNLMKSLYRDGIIYFIYMFSISLANVTILYTTSSESYIILLAIMHRALHAILSCRIILNLRRASVAARSAETKSRSAFAGTIKLQV